MFFDDIFSPVVMGRPVYAPRRARAYHPTASWHPMASPFSMGAHPTPYTHPVYRRDVDDHDDEYLYPYVYREGKKPRSSPHHQVEGQEGEQAHVDPLSRLLRAHRRRKAAEKRRREEEEESFSSASMAESESSTSRSSEEKDYVKIPIKFVRGNDTSSNSSSSTSSDTSGTNTPYQNDEFHSDDSSEEVAMEEEHSSNTEPKHETSGQARESEEVEMEDSHEADELDSEELENTQVQVHNEDEDEDEDEEVQEEEHDEQDDCQLEEAALLIQRVLRGALQRRDNFFGKVKQLTKMAGQVTELKNKYHDQVKNLLRDPAVDVETLKPFLEYQEFLTRLLLECDNMSGLRVKNLRKRVVNAINKELDWLDKARSFFKNTSDSEDSSFEHSDSSSSL